MSSSARSPLPTLNERDAEQVLGGGARARREGGGGGEGGLGGKKGVVGGVVTGKGGQGPLW